MFQNLRKAKKLVVITLTCAAFAIAGCGSDADATKDTADTGKAVTWSETFDGTKTDFSVKTPPTMPYQCLNNNGNDVAIRT